MQAARRLTPTDIENFLDYGFVRIPAGLDPDFCRQQVDIVMKRLDMSLDDPSTWTRERLHIPSVQTYPWREHAPVVWDAINDLLGDGRAKEDSIYGDGMVINFRAGADQPWQPPGPDVSGWHKDGNFFRHYLDSPEQALLVIIVWKDIAHRGGGTFFAPDSVGHLARFLVERPEGVQPGQFPFGDLIRQCRDFREITASAGDVFLLHPYMLHSVSRNPSGTVRFISNPFVAINEPMCFDRPNPADFSVVERSILRHLGVDRLDWRITGEREHYAPNHLKGYEDFLKERQATST